MRVDIIKFKTCVICDDIPVAEFIFKRKAELDAEFEGWENCKCGDRCGAIVTIIFKKSGLTI